jgi:hypothetical protein
MTWRAPILILVAVAVLVAGRVYLPYIGWSNSNADARARAEAYLRAVAGADLDRGWSLLEPSSRAAYRSEDAYRRLMAAADWSAFAWEVRGNGLCDDGVCSFVVWLRNGRASVPDVAWSGGPGHPGVLVSSDRRADQAEAFLDVRQRGWFGGIGIVVFGQTREWGSGGAGPEPDAAIGPAG